jgi:hypothetical protein
MVEHIDYYDNRKCNGLNSIVISMSPDIHDRGLHGYGDFGRYVWQAAISDFKGVDDEKIVNLYYYTMKFIIEELGYRDDLFGGYDFNLNHFVLSRHQTMKTERIGKKYQWIALYNVLARLSDRHTIEGDWHMMANYCGPWNLCVRDFDPTLNTRKLLSVTLPQIKLPNSAIEIDWIVNNSTADDDRENWIAYDTLFFTRHVDDLLVEYQDIEWIVLFQYCTRKSDTNDKNSDPYNQIVQKIWSMSFSYITSSDDYERIMKCMVNKPLNRRSCPEAREIYSLFNREYCWSPGYMDISFGDWREIDEHGRSTDKGHCETTPIGKVMPAYINYAWGTQYDASQDEVTSFNIPCGLIINGLSLHQKDDDGLLYAGNDLVAFDSRFIKDAGSHFLIIRKDSLWRFLEENNLRLFWLCIGEKQSFLGNLGDMKRSNWSGIYTLKKDSICGRMTKNTNNT